MQCNILHLWFEVLQRIVSWLWFALHSRGSLVYTGLHALPTPCIALHWFALLWFTLCTGLDCSANSISIWCKNSPDFSGKVIVVITIIILIIIIIGVIIIGVIICRQQHCKYHQLLRGRLSLSLLYHQQNCIFICAIQIAGDTTLHLWILLNREISVFIYDTFRFHCKWATLLVQLLKIVMVFYIYFLFIKFFVDNLEICLM